MHRTAMKWLTISAVLGGLTGAVLISVSCGGDNSARPTGSGGGTGSGGATGGAAGTTAGSGGATGGGGATVNCQPPLAPADGTMTTFTAGTDWNATSGKWGTSSGFRGAVYSYGDSNTSTAALTKTVDGTAGNFRLNGTIQPGGYAGGGLSFDVCTTIAAFNAIQFSISGDNGGCDLELQIQNYSQKGVSAGGGCPSGSSCWAFPTKKTVAVPTATAQVITVPFADLTNWSTAAAAEIVGVQFQFTVPPPADPDGGVQTACTPDIRLDDLTFITQ